MPVGAPASPGLVGDSASTSGGHVLHVLLVRPRLQVIRVDARRIVAAMPEYRPPGDRAAPGFIYDSVRTGGLNSLAMEADEPVSMPVASAPPLPAPAVGDIPSDRFNDYH